MHARRAPDALQRPPQSAQRENLLLFVWLQDVAHLGEGLHVRRLRPRLGRQLIVGFEVSTNCRLWVSAEAQRRCIAAGACCFRERLSQSKRTRLLRSRARGFESSTPVWGPVPPRRVPKRTYSGHRCLSGYGVRGNAMPKAEVVGRAPRRRARRRPAKLPNTVEGQIAEICRDLAVQAKRMQQLHEQADELRTAIHEWATRSEAKVYREPVSREGRR